MRNYMQHNSNQSNRIIIDFVYLWKIFIKIEKKTEIVNCDKRKTIELKAYKIYQHKIGAGLCTPRVKYYNKSFY